MFAKKRTPMYETVASDMKALHGRHARLDSGLKASRAVGVPAMANGAGAYAEYDVREQRMAAEDANIAYRKAHPAAQGSTVSSTTLQAADCIAHSSQVVSFASSREGFAPRRASKTSAYPTSAASQSSQKLATASELESKFQEFFRMGAVVAIGELFDEGMLGDKAAVAEDVRDYLDSFGVASLADVQALGVSGPYLQDFEYIFGASASFPPAA